MKHNLKNKSILKYLKDILAIPSPTGNTYNAMDYIVKTLKEIGADYTITNKGAVIASIKGKNDNYQRTFSAHLDTLGAMVKEIKSNGSLGITPVGGFMMSSIDGENCLIETIDSRVYTGTIQNIMPSVHISGDEARELKKTAKNMEIILDEKVFNKEDVEGLGINIGDFVSFDTRTVFTEKGFVKSRHLDDKASAAVLLYIIEYIISSKIELPYTTNFFISNYEEVGHGAKASHPVNTKEFIAVDMGAPGPGQNSSEYSVCICAKDSSGPYDLELKKKLVQVCRDNSISYKIDIYPYYGSDASAALSAGWDFKTALIGPGVFASHAYERTHSDALMATAQLVLEYSLTE